MDLDSRSPIERLLAAIPAPLAEGLPPEVLGRLAPAGDLGPSDAPDEALRAHPLVALKWSLLGAGAARLVADLQVALRDLRARLDARTRVSLGEAGARVTEPMVTASVESDPDYRRACQELHELEAIARVCSDMQELLRQRFEVLLLEARRGRGVRAAAGHHASPAPASARPPATLAQAALLVTAREGAPHVALSEPPTR